MYKPGNIVPISGQYGVVDAFRIYLGVERTCVKGEPFPPITTPRGAGYVLRDATKH
ncbi:MAG TPA: YjzC family protein [Solirubrobacterales bacterium]|nr:YjzC family protein [Solirubrobacterales bacterium]